MAPPLDDDDDGEGGEGEGDGDGDGAEQAQLEANLPRQLAHATKPERSVEYGQGPPGIGPSMEKKAKPEMPTNAPCCTEAAVGRNTAANLWWC